ncbi:nucleotidyl transferase AbiEii/AbiGii toxin family protein [Trueperella bialowiezensis]|uniref:Nucleotidyl transferase of uncharacterized function (DUF1814) n=1 Tax=Trueperella bialowiezensis TaxID=312285 RepID=A0A448PEX4_9ACTO|nr:nucleotidyl transferase AbiEii/AbiGii toxin family protein [Trueperella bialowiezensis]VEI13476.1 Nucleotidyl transferase of uncharacterised function (DUF1814) [Trueperella bialowiezensis]
MLSSSANQRRLIRESLDALEPYGFALAGSGAIREHGITARPTEDVDLFTVMEFKSDFAQAVLTLEAHLLDLGYNVKIYRQTATFCQLVVTDSTSGRFNVDLGIDWRQNQPTQFSVGPVLSQDDAVANKIAALYSRGEPRDYLDADAIRQSALYTDAELLALAQSSDPGFDLTMFTYRLRAVETIDYRRVEPYDIDPAEYERVQRRLISWAISIESAE